MSTHKYAVLSETSGKEHCTWSCFIQYDGNEEILEKLYKLFTSIQQCIYGDMSTFILDIKNLVSEITATEMCKVETNEYSTNCKVNGKLMSSVIDFDISSEDNNKDIMFKINDKLCVNGIIKYYCK